MKNQDKPKSKLDKMISKKESLLKEPKRARNNEYLGKITGFPNSPSIKKYLTSKAKADSVMGSKMIPAIKKELVNIKPSKQITIKVKSDNTKVVKPVIKEIIKSKFLKAKKK